MAALLSASVLVACGGGGDAPAEVQAESSASQSAATDAGAAQVLASAKYAGQWQQCLVMSSTPVATSKRDTFEIEVVSDTVVSYRQSRTYHLNGDCSLPPGQNWEGQTYYRGHGTFELLGQAKQVGGIASETALWKSELPSDFADAGGVEKTTLGIKDGTLYIGNTTGPLDAEGFPDAYYHALIQIQ